MQLLGHVSDTVRELPAVKPFYRATMAALGAIAVYDEHDAIGFGERNDCEETCHTHLSVFASAQALPDTRRHWCFKAPSAQAVRKFHSAGLANGGQEAGAPGIRSDQEGCFAAFLLDPEGIRWRRFFIEAPDESS